MRMGSLHLSLFALRIFACLLPCEILTSLQPPKKSVHEDPPDMHIALNLKYGIHTFVVLADPLAPFSNVTSELWFALRDRLDKDQGLKAAHDEPPRPLPPVGKDVRIAYAVLKDTRNTSKGWKDLDIQGDETPVSKGLKNNATVAFVICDVNDDEEPVPEFVVQWPRLEEDSEEEDDTELRGGAEAVDEDDGMDS